MSEQLGKERAQRPTLQAKYRYLADFSKQESPNLRKQYRQSVSPHQFSNQRLSPSGKCSPYHSSNKRVPRLQRFSPSCSTFNPRREATQQQFSPYDDRAEKQQSRVNNELRQESRQLRFQLNQSKQLIQSLRGQLKSRELQLIKVKQSNQADLRYFQKVASEMTGQIQIVLTKNKILENQLIVTKGRLHEQVRKIDQLVKNEQERKIADRRKEEVAKFRQDKKIIDQRRKERDDLDKQQRKLNQLSNKVANQPPSRRSVGKLMSKPAPLHYQSKNQPLETSKIKIEGQFQSVQKQNCQNKRIDNLPSRQQAEKQNKKGDQLIESILGMHHKITGRQVSSLKELWKWLKEMGCSQSCLKRWKPKAQAGLYLNSQRLRQLLKQACSYIQ